VSGGETLLVKLAGSREEFTRDLPQQDAVPRVGYEVEGDLLTP